MCAVVCAITLGLEKYIQNLDSNVRGYTLKGAHMYGHLSCWLGWWLVLKLPWY